jgi:hypothetical protein
MNKNIPYIKNKELIIPFNCPEKYKYWSNGQSIKKTLIELGASKEMIQIYCPKHITEGMPMPGKA